MSSEKNIILVSNDGESFEVDEAVALQSVMLRHMLELIDYDGSPVTLPNISRTILSLVLEYCVEFGPTL